MIVMYLSVSSLNLIGQSVFESGNGNVDEQTNGQKMDKQTELENFERNLAMIGDLSSCQV